MNANYKLRYSLESYILFVLSLFTGNVFSDVETHTREVSAMLPLTKITCDCCGHGRNAYAKNVRVRASHTHTHTHTYLSLTANTSTSRSDMM